MILTLVATAVSLAQAASLGVPFVPQTDALCGGAAAAMVFRYWGEPHAGVDQFGTLVERRAGGVAGIAADVLVRAIAARGWRTEHAEPSLGGLRDRLDAKQPVIVLIADRHDLYHYVVVVGLTDEAVVVHDPSWGPSRSIPTNTFERLWAAAQYWSLVVLPSGTRADEGQTRGPSPGLSLTALPASGDCDAVLNRAIDDVQVQGLERADDILATVRARCPAAAGPYRELAGVRFAQKRWADAAILARQAIAREPNDAYAYDVLGSSLFMLDDPQAALRAWNHVGKPRLDVVQIEGVHHARYQVINDALRLKPNAMLTADAFAQATHRLDDLPDRGQARLSVRPQADGFARVDVALAERAGRPRGYAGWIGTAARAAVDRETSVVLPGFTGQGEVWTGSWRWWRNRPRVAMGFAAPRVGGLFGVWRVEGGWDAETYADAGAIRREEHKHAGLNVSDWMSGSLRYALSSGADVWDSPDGGRRATSLGGSLERRWFDDRLSIAGDATVWMPLDRGRAFTATGVKGVARSKSEARGWIYEGTAGVGRVSDTAPLGLWLGAGEGRARPALLRAHPLLDNGMIDVGTGSAFGRSIQYGNAEAQRWLSRPKAPRMALATFVDVARTSRRADASVSMQADVGAGLRVRVPGVSKVMRVDIAHGLIDGTNALTVGFAY